MGTDRSQAYHGLCPCGSGEIEIDFCTPDHPWPTKSNWFEPRMSCQACAAKYQFEEQNGQYGLVERREIKGREKRYEAYKSARAELLASPEASEIISRFVQLLDAQPSMAAAHRLLASKKLVYDSYGTFIKRWRGAESWVKDHIGLQAESLLKFAELSGIENELISKAVSELKKLWLEYERPLPFHGGAILDKARYH